MMNSRALPPPDSITDGIRVAMIEHNGAPVEPCALCSVPCISWADIPHVHHFYVDYYVGLCV